MKRFLGITAALTFLAGTAYAQIAFTGSYGNDFDGLGPAGTTYDPGWTGVRWAGSGPAGETLTLGVTAGTASSGGVYNVGSSADADRALGTVASGTTVPRFGAQFQNTSGATIDGVTLSGDTEQWRTGANATADEVVGFEYSLNATDINDSAGTWVAVSGMDLTEKLTTSTSAGAVDGNLEANRGPISASLQGLNWVDGGTLTIRWSDSDVTGSDGLYAVDNFTMTAVPEPSTCAVLGMAAVGLIWRRVRRR